MTIVKNRTILLIASCAFEAGHLIKKLGKKSEEVIGGKLFCQGRIGSKHVAVCISGIGKTNAAHAVTLAIARFSPAAVINFGVAGAYPDSGLKPGDIAIAESEFYGDEGVCVRDGFYDLKKIGLPLYKKAGRKYFNGIPLDRSLAERGLNAVQNTLNINAKKGPFVTVSTCTGTLKRAKELQSRFSPICENMEGAAIAHVCDMHGIPMSELRGISNSAEERNRRKWQLKTAALNCSHAVLKFLETF